MKVSRMMGLAAVLSFGASVAVAGNSPFDDCVWWFDGGRLGAGETSRTVVSGVNDLFDLMHASTPDGATHKSSMVGKGAVIIAKEVTSPLLGTATTAPVLSMPQEKDAEGKFYPAVFTLPADVKAQFNAESDVTVIARVKIPQYADGIRGKTFFFMDLGYKQNGTDFYGIPIGFYCDTGQDMFHLYYWARRDGSRSESSQSSDVFGTDEWVDVAFILKDGYTALGVLKTGSASVSWTEKKDSILHCGVGGDPIYIGRGNSGYTQGTATRSNWFAGDIARLAVWNRALSKDEVLTAFGQGACDQQIVGLKNGTSAEFGGSVPLAAVTEGFDWKSALADNAAPQLASGESFAYSFTQPVNADKTGNKVTPVARQKVVVFSLTEASAGGRVQVQANGGRVFDLDVEPGKEYACVVRSKFLKASSTEATPNTIGLLRTDSGAGKIEFDSIVFASDWQIGYQDGSQNDLKDGTGDYDFKMYSEPWTKWSKGHPFKWAISYSGFDAFTFYVPPTLAEQYGSRYVFTRIGDAASDPESITGLYVDVNGVRKLATDVTWGADSTATYEVDFAPGELLGGYNTIKFGSVYDPARTTKADGTYYGLRGWLYSDFHRFEWIYQSPQKRGLMLILR